MDVEELFDALKKTQEPKGFFNNRDMEQCLALLEALLTNLKRYGYMACPCRLAKNDREADRDIICPCVYRSADVEEFGSCYCGLYVSREWNRGEIPVGLVPERRPAEKC